MREFYEPVYQQYKSTNKTLFRGKLDLLTKVSVINIFFLSNWPVPRFSFIWKNESSTKKEPHAAYISCDMVVMVVVFFTTSFGVYGWEWKGLIQLLILRSHKTPSVE